MHTWWARCCCPPLLSGDLGERLGNDMCSEQAIAMRECKSKGAGRTFSSDIILSFGTVSSKKVQYKVFSKCWMCLPLCKKVATFSVVTDPSKLVLTGGWFQNLPQDLLKLSGFCWNKIISEAIQAAWFSYKKGMGVEYSTYFDPIPLVTLALTLTAVSEVIQSRVQY